MISTFLHRWLQSLKVPTRGARRPRNGMGGIQPLEVRTLLSVSVVNNGGAGFAGLSFNQSGGYVPPDTNGAAGPAGYVETVNQAIALYNTKSTGAGAVTDSLAHFFFTTGGLNRADSGSGQSDPVVTYDDQIGRYVVGDQDVNFNTHVSAFDMAVSKSSNPTTLSAADWTFYKITTTETGFDADYPGNLGYNHDALVFTLNMFGVSGGGHSQVVSVSASDLASGSASPQIARNDLADFSVRPTAMHDAVAGDPMWLVTEHGDNKSIDVIKMAGVLTNAATFAYTNLAVTPYSSTVTPLNPNGTVITNNIDSRILKAAEANSTIVAAHSVAASSTQDVAQWYAIDVSSGTPKLLQQGRVGAGANTYVVYPGIEINAAGQIGMSYIQSGTDSPTDYLSMYVTARNASDPIGAMETPVLVPAGTGVANYADFTKTGRAGDLSGINVDPVDGTFWAANEFANTQSVANWGTAIANFSPAAPVNTADLAVSNSGPSSITAGSQVTYTITVTNHGPNAAAGAVLSDALPAGALFVSMTQTAGSDAFVFGQSGGTITETAGGAIASGSSDTFSLVVSAPASLAAGSTFSDTASVSAATADPNTANNSATVTGTIAGLPADLAVAVSGPATGAEGDTFTYQVTVTNLSTNAATGAVVVNTLDPNLKYISATAGQGTFSQGNGVVTYQVGTIAAGASVKLTVTAQALEEGTLVNSASVSAVSADPNPANNSGSTATSVTEPAIVVSAPISVSGKNTGNITVATFTHASGVEPASDFQATINWGDGSTSKGTIVLAGGIYRVTGSHRYRSNGSHTVSTAVSEIGLGTRLLLAKIGDEVPDLPAQAGDTEKPHGNSASHSHSPQFVSTNAARGSEGLPAVVSSPRSTLLFDLATGKWVVESL